MSEWIKVCKKTKRPANGERILAVDYCDEEYRGIYLDTEDEKYGLSFPRVVLDCEIFAYVPWEDITRWAPIEKI